jgi:hypothetical protein
MLLSPFKGCVNSLLEATMPMLVVDGRQIAAARALANIGVQELAEAAGVTPRTIGRLEVDATITVADRRRHGCVSREIFDRVVAALRQRGIELLPEGGDYGSGVRWTAPRAKRSII